MMGKKRVTYDLNEGNNKPPNHIVNDHHRHHHHHRHQNRQKSKKIKPEAKLLHTLNSHLKKIAKSRSRKTISLSTPPPPPPPTKGLHGNNKQNHVHFSSWLKNDDIDQLPYDDWFMGFECEHDNAYFDDGGELGVFEFGQELLFWKNMTFECNEDHFGWDCVFEPDLNAGPNLVFVFEEEEDGFVYGSIPDPVMNFEGMYICDVWELSSQEDMINEFIKVNLFVS